MRKFIFISLTVFLILRFLTNFVYFSIDGKISLRVIMLIGVALNRMCSLPFILEFLFLARLQVMQVQTFTDSLESKDLDKEKQVVIKSQAAIYSSIKKTAEEYYIYVTFLVIFLCIFGLRFAGDINLIEAHIKITALKILYHVKEIVESALDIAIYVVVLMNISRVSLAQKNILSKLLNLISCDIQGYDVRLNTINIFEKHHHLDGTGYSVFGITISGMKTLLFAVFI